MDPKLLFWTAATINFAGICFFALTGARYARRGEIARHKRSMKIGSFMVVGFVVAYGLKLYFLGREDMSVWSSLDVWVLRIHELFILQMLCGGTVAWIQGRKLLPTRLVTHDPADPIPDPGTRRIHRLAGRTSVIGACLACVLAFGVLAGMYARAY